MVTPNAAGGGRADSFDLTSPGFTDSPLAGGTNNYTGILPNNTQGYVPLSFGTVNIYDTTVSPPVFFNSFSAGTDPEFVVFKSDSSTAYISNQGSSSVSQVDTGSLTVTNIPTAADPLFLGISSDDSKVVVSHSMSDQLSIIDTALMSVVANFPLLAGSSPSFVAMANAASPPVVTSVSPNSGRTTGGTSVTITGTGFTGATAVSFGGTPAASFMVNSATQIIAISPAHAAGTVDITVTTPSGTSAVSAADQFTFINVNVAPVVSGVSPNVGSTAGGTTVIITGSNFTGATAVSFGGGNPAASFTVNSATQITAISPPHTPGTVDILVTTPAGGSATSAADHFTFVSPVNPTVLLIAQETLQQAIVNADEEIERAQQEVNNVGIMGVYLGTYPDTLQIYIIDSQTPFVPMTEMIPVWCQ